MASYERINLGYFAKVNAIIAGLLVLWWGGLFSVTGKEVDRHPAKARILAVYQKTWEIRLEDGRKATIMVDKPRSHKPGDDIHIQLVRYNTGRVEAVYTGVFGQ